MASAVRGYATAALVLGIDGMEWLAGMDRIEAMAITDSRSVIVTDGFEHFRIE